MKTTTLIATAILSTITLNANNTNKIEVSEHTEKTIAKVYCNLLKKGDIKLLSKHFVGHKKDWINTLSLEELNNVSKSISNRYKNADCNYIDLKTQSIYVKAFPYASKWNYSFSFDEDNGDWEILNY